MKITEINGIEYADVRARFVALSFGGLFEFRTGSGAPHFFEGRFGKTDIFRGLWGAQSRPQGRS